MAAKSYFIGDTEYTSIYHGDRLIRQAFAGETLVYRAAQAASPPRNLQVHSDGRPYNLPLVVFDPYIRQVGEFRASRPLFQYEYRVDASDWQGANSTPYHSGPQQRRLSNFDPHLIQLGTKEYVVQLRSRTSFGLSRAISATVVFSTVPTAWENGQPELCRYPRSFVLFGYECRRAAALYSRGRYSSLSSAS